VHECFIRQWHPAGEECQFDWGEMKLCIAGRWMKLRMAAFALPHSNHRRGYLFIREHTLAFQEAHRNYFHDIGHIPVRMVYDNMRVAVKSFVGSEKHPTDALLDLSNFYGLEWRFCNARRGNEKGTVEETVKVLRKAYYSVPDRLTLQEVKVRDYTNKIEVLEKGTVVAAHEKTADGLWKLTLEHYLTTLSHKPGAVRNAEALRQAPDGIRRLFSSSFETCPKDFVELLLFAREKGKTYEDVEEAYDRLRKSRVSHVTLELMKQALLPGVCRQGKEGGLDLERFLCELLQAENEQRAENAQKKRLKTAGFPQYKYMEELDMEELPEGARLLADELKTLKFVREGRSAVFYGNPGTGKTHLSIALGILACRERMTVMFTSVPHLITQIKECRSQQTLHALETRFRRYDLVICDEFGYMACDKEGGELLFNHLSLRAEDRSTIITTNLAFDRWGEIIRDKVLVAAMVDRLTHNAHLINMNGQSYRLKETKAFNEQKQNEK
jgi:DNA replication protein DnaC